MNALASAAPAAESPAVFPVTLSRPFPNRPPRTLRGTSAR
jgi:hypothetical protein